MLGQLIKGVWYAEDRSRTNATGEFERKQSDYRSYIGSEKYKAEAGRYHLFVNAGCPWAYRTILYRSIKNLSGLITMSYSRPAAGTEGWTFGEPEPLLGAVHMHQVYTADNSSFTGRCTVPVLWDKESNSIVNNESADIIRMFNSAFDSISGVDQIDYYPEPLRARIDSLNEKIYENVNNGVYRCGFSSSQQAYNDAFELLFDTLDELDDLLGNQRYLCGEIVTEADWRLFSTLVRFDLAYHGQFKCNRQQLKDYINLWPYCRDLYQLPRVADTVDIDAIKGIYYGGRGAGVIPRGPVIDFEEPHNRG